MSAATTAADTMLSPARVLAALEGAFDPCSVAAGRPMHLVEMGLVDDVRVEGEDVHIALTLTSPSCMMLGQIMDQIDGLIMPLTGGRRPKITFDDGLSWTPDRIRGAAAAHRRDRREVLVQLGRRTS